MSSLPGYFARCSSNDDCCSEDGQKNRPLVEDASDDESDQVQMQASGTGECWMDSNDSEPEFGNLIDSEALEAGQGSNRLSGNESEEVTDQGGHGGGELSDDASAVNEVDTEGTDGGMETKRIQVSATTA